MLLFVNDNNVCKNRNRNLQHSNVSASLIHKMLFFYSRMSFFECAQRIGNFQFSALVSFVKHGSFAFRVSFLQNVRRETLKVQSSKNRVMYDYFTVFFLVGLSL